MNYSWQKLMFALGACANAQGPGTKPDTNEHTQDYIASKILLQLSHFTPRNVASCSLFPIVDRAKWEAHSSLHFLESLL